jgi:hypothetical protein
LSAPRRVGAQARQAIPQGFRVFRAHGFENRLLRRTRQQMWRDIAEPVVDHRHLLTRCDAMFQSQPPLEFTDVDDARGGQRDGSGLPGTDMVQPCLSPDSIAHYNANWQDWTRFEID